MARIRTIKPEFWTSEQVMECSPIARLLFIGLWNFCDDGGNHPASAKTLKAEVFPGDDISAAQVQSMLAELSANGLVVFYEHAGKEYIHVTGWQHQKIEKPTYKHPKHEAAKEGAKATGNGGMQPQAHVVDNDSSNARRGVAEESPSSPRPLDPVMEGKGKEEEQEQEPPLPPAAEQPAGEQPELPLTPEPDHPKRRARNPDPKFDPLSACPPNVSPEVWAKWVKCRKEQGKPLKETTCEAQAKQLAGHPKPDAVIENSIAAGWQGLFPDRVAASAGNVHPFPSSKNAPSRHHGFEDRDYFDGLTEREDGTYAL